MAPQPPLAPTPTPADLDALFAAHQRDTLPRLAVLWAYYRNPTAPSWWAATARALDQRAGSARPARLAQERALPARFWSSGALRTPWEADRSPRREIVVENDIAWRLHTMVDFLFNRPLRLTSTAANPTLAAKLTDTLEAIWEASGGMSLLQDAALLAHVHGYVDLLIRLLPADDTTPDTDPLTAAIARIRIELLDPFRSVPIPSSLDYRELDGYLLRTIRRDGESLSALTEVFTRDARALWQQPLNDSAEPTAPARLIERESRPAHRALPIIHIQNVSQPFAYSGLSEVEPLIPLQDELNTRLSDRANRVTLQSFKMYLAKGIDGFDRREVAPGTVWCTDNDQAKIEAFGGDAAAPSEEAHIDEIREAMDKVSGVPPLAAGVVRAKIGNLTSENALRVTLQGLLTRTARKRVTWGRAISDACRLILAELHALGALKTQEQDRRVNVQWPDALPRDVADELKSAQAKRDLGLSPDQVLADLGLGPTNRGVE